MEWAAIKPRTASAVRIANSTAFLLRTGKTPGRPRQTGQVWELGASPNRVLQPQKIFDAVRSWACTSSPITASYVSSEFIVHSSRSGPNVRSPTSDVAKSEEGVPSEAGTIWLASAGGPPPERSAGG